MTKERFGCKTLRRYALETGAAIAIMFGLMAPVLVGITGMAMDFSRAYLVKQRLALALDSAALAAAAGSTNEAVIRARLLEFFRRNYPEGELGLAFDPEVTIDGDVITVTGTAEYETLFLRVLGITTLSVGARVEVTRTVGNSLELVMVLDLSGSMNELTRLPDLKDAAKSLIDTVIYTNQEHYYSKIAIVPWSMGVNVGNYATAVRGPVTGPLRTITGATKANPVVVTASGHGFSNGQKVYITGVSGMTQLNNKEYTVASATTNTFALQGVDGRNYGTHSGSNGVVGRVCTSPGCGFFKFTNASGGTTYLRVSTCVSERTGSEAFTDAPPSDTYLGWNYPASNNPCLSSMILPLTSNKTVLKNNIDNLVAVGSTAGHIGAAWGWYMLSPEFGYLWPEVSRPADYFTEELYKVAVFMTDGEFNSPHCQGVISRDSTEGSGSASNKINCNAPNGSSFYQTEQLCDAMKAKGIEIYTIGFHITAGGGSEEVMEYCASSPEHYFSASDGAQLKSAFDAIANNVKSLRLTQ